MDQNSPTALEPNAEQEAIRQAALQQIREALSFLEDVDASVFIEALEKVPHLVDLESDPLKFLRREGYDIPKAAKRLCLYWQFRKQIFDDRAFLPMTLCGDGAMDQADIDAFRQGHQIPLPLAADGHSVVFTDKLSLYKLPPTVRRRCGFYSFQIASENEKSITEGFIAVTLFGDMAAATSTKNTAALAMDGIPANLHCNHVFALPVDEDKVSQNNFFANFAGIMLTMLGMEVFQKTLLHVTTTPEENKAKLFALGFSEDKIPPTMGGTWDTNRLGEWIEERIAIEKKRYAFLKEAPETAEIDTTQTSVLKGSDGIIDPLLGQPLLQDSAFDVFQRQELLQTFSSAGNGASDPASPGGMAGLPGPELPATHLLQQYLTACRTVPGFTALISSDGQTPLSAAGVPNIPPTLMQQQQQQQQDKPAASGLAALTAAANAGIVNGSAVASETASAAQASEEEYRRNGIKSSPIMQETEAIRQAARVATEEALKTIPDKDKAAYLEALQTCPELIKTESDMLRFARVEGYNAVAAARRLVDYWEHRKDLFGERAFLPMTQTGLGALSKEDIVILSCGCTAITRKDVAGRSVVVGDRQKLIEKSADALKARLRAVFYILTVLSEEELHQKEGIVWISSLITPRVIEFNPMAVTGISKALMCMPIKLKVVHFVVIPPKTANKEKVEGIADQINDGLEKNNQAHKYSGIMLIHKRSSVQEISDVLKSFGIPPECVPHSCGGTWKYEEFTKWQRQRSQFEQTVRRLDVGYTQPCNRRTATESQTLTETEKKERKRQLNVIHSRQKRERRKAEAEELKSQCNSLEKQNRQLKNENAHLEELWTEVQHRVSMLEQGAGGTAAAPSSIQDAFGGGVGGVSGVSGSTTDFHQQLLARQLLLNQAMGGGGGSASAQPSFSSMDGGNGAQLPVGAYPPSGVASSALHGSMRNDHALPFGNASQPQLGNLGNNHSFTGHPQLQQAPQQPQGMDMSMFMSGVSNFQNNSNRNNDPSFSSSRFP